MAENRVIDYEAASELANDDWLLIDGVTEGTRKARPSVVNAELANQVNQIGNVVSSLTGIAMGHEHSFAPSYDETESYVVGDLVMYNAYLYKCTADATGTWDSSKWQAVTVAEQLEESGKVDDIINKGESLVVNKIADLSDMQDDIDSKVADATVADTSIVDENHVLKMDNLLAKADLPTGAISTIEDGSALPMPSLKVSIEAVQSGSGDPSPTNIRPFTGWSAVNRYDTGKNLFFHTIGSGSYRGVTYTFNSDGTFETGDTSTNTINLTLGTMVLPAGTYFLSGCPSGGGLRTYGLQAVDNPITTSYGQDFGDGVEFTLTKKTNISIRFQVGAINVNMDNLTFKPILTLSSQKPDDFVPYNGQVYTTTLKDGQGNPLTCYGGELSNENGVQTLENATEIVVLDGSSDEAWEEWEGAFLINGIFNWNSVTSATNPVCMCNMYIEENAVSSSSQLPRRSDFSFFNQTAYIDRLWVKDSRYSTVEDFKTALASQPLQIRYTLATPQTIPQDNLAISTQDGTNNIWADTGDVLSGEYYRNVGVTLTDLISRVEALENA